MAIGHDSPTNTNDQEDHHQRNEESIGVMDHHNIQGGDEGHQTNTELVDQPRNIAPFITDDIQCFVCGRYDHFLDQCPDYKCEKCGRQNPGHYEKFCFLQENRPHPKLAVAQRQANRARHDFPVIFSNEPISTFIIGLTPTRRRFLARFLAKARKQTNSLLS